MAKKNVIGSERLRTIFTLIKNKFDSLTKADVGLSNVDNTSDADKRVAYADTAGSATDSTKLPLTGGTMTGPITSSNSTAIQPNTNGSGNVGTNTKRFGYGYFTNLLSGNVRPFVNNNGNVGTSSYRYATAYINQIYGTLNGSSTYANNASRSWGLGVVDDYYTESDLYELYSTTGIVAARCSGQEACAICLPIYYDDGGEDYQQYEFIQLLIEYSGDIKRRYGYWDVNQQNEPTWNSWEQIWPVSDNTKLPLSGGQMTGQLLTSFQSSVAIGSRQVQATSLPAVLEELRYSNGGCGSLSLTTSYIKDSTTVPASWYNYFYAPHRSGGINGQPASDNTDYGTLILCGMTSYTPTFVVRYANGIQDIHAIFSYEQLLDNAPFANSLVIENGILYLKDYQGNRLSGVPNVSEKKLVWTSTATLSSKVIKGDSTEEPLTIDIVAKNSSGVIQAVYSYIAVHNGTDAAKLSNISGAISSTYGTLSTSTTGVTITNKANYILEVWVTGSNYTVS